MEQQIPVETPISTEPVSQVIPSPSMPMPDIYGTKKAFPWLPLIFSLLFVVILIAGIFFYFRTQSLQKQLTTIATPAASTSPTSPYDSMTDWKTYTNKDLGFELKYPPTVQIDKEMNDEYNKATIFRGGELYFEVMIRTGREASDIDLANYYYMDNSDFTKSTLAGRVANIYIQDMSKSSCVSDGTGPGCPLSYVVYAVAIGKSLYHVSFYGDAMLSDTEKKILDTFRFLDSVATDPNVKTFTSEKLGITFKYQEKYKGLTEVATAKEVGNKVYVYMSNTTPDKGQYVEIFDKDAEDPINEAIAKSVLFGYLPEDCPITIKGKKGAFGNSVVYPEGYNTAVIGIPGSPDMEEAGPFLEKCPSKYVAFGGVAYFLIDQASPTKLAFFSIGQYVLNGDKNDNGWQDTFRFTK